MPLYEFICERCGHSFDVLRPIDDRNNKATCPKCLGSKTVRNRVSPFALPRPTTAPTHAQASVAQTPVGRPNLILRDCLMQGADKGIVMEGGWVHSEGLTIRDTRIGIDNKGGYFDGPDTKFE